MASIYRETRTGDWYVEENGFLSHQMNANGVRMVTLSPPRGNVLSQDKKVIPNLSKYKKMQQQHALSVVMSYKSFLTNFIKVENLYASPNVPINQLLREYEAEDSDHTNMKSVASIAQRYVQTMPDSQIRCLLHVLSINILENSVDSKV